MAKITNLQALLVHALQELHDAESQLVVALRRFAAAARDESLAAAFFSHREETCQQLDRLDRALGLMLAEPAGRGAEAMRQLVAAADARLRAKTPAPLRDAALVAHAQKIEHFEIAGYTSALRIADVLEHHELAALLRETLAEETAAGEKLTVLARTLVPAAKISGVSTPYQPAVASAQPRVLRIPTLREILPARLGERPSSARRARKFDPGDADFSGSRTPRKRATRSAKPKRKTKPARATTPKRAKAKPRARSAKQRPARRKRAPRTDE